MDYYYAMVSTSYGRAFVLNECGTCFTGRNTPADLGLEDGDEIICFC